MSERGIDIEEVFEQLKAETDMAEAVGIDISSINPIIEETSNEQSN